MEDVKEVAEQASSAERVTVSHEQSAELETLGSLPKYRRIYEDLRSAIESGALVPGSRLPSEAELGERYGTSRITIAKAVNELSLRGFVSRRAGSGTHVLKPSAAPGHVFGLLIPDLGRTEIFEPICHGMMQSPLSKPHSLLWGHAMGEAAQQEQEAEQLCHQYIKQKVSGLFFAPLEFTAEREAVNSRIVSALDRAGVPLVLLDRSDISDAQCSRHDLVGIDNRRTGLMITQHLLQLGARRVAFVAKPRSASTVLARIAGYREALYNYGISLNENLVRRGDPEDPAFHDLILNECRPDAIVCANDSTAARLMAGLASKGVRVPEDVRIVGIDDVKYAAMLPVPLTTQHQNCADIGWTAMATMLQRLQFPELPARDIFLPTHTVVRRSCGAHLTARQSS